MASWQNWAGNVAAEPRALVQPGSVDELRTAVREAAARGETVRVAGSGHSFSPICHSTGTVIDLARMAGIESVDPATGEAVIWAGTKLHAIGEPLFKAGRAFANQGDIDRQALAGAVGTGTHGTGRRHGSFANAVRAVELMTPEGDLVWIDEHSPADHLRAVALSLGMLGVMTRIRVSTVPAYKLREQTQAIDLETCLEQYLGIEEASRNAEFWWIPPLDTCVLKRFTETDEEPFSQPETEHPPGTIERYLKPDKVDWSYRVYPSTRSLPFVECEYTLPIDAAPAAVRATRTMMQERHRDVRWGVEYRTLAAEHHLLSPTAGQESVTISVHQAADLPWTDFMRDAEAIFLAHGGRPHWGKLHTLTRAQVDALYPEAARFREIRRHYDPRGIFLNDHLRPLFGEIG